LSVTPSITIITTPIKDPDSFASMYIEERRERSGGWESFTLRSGLLVDSFLLRATRSDLGVFGDDDVDSVANGAGKMTSCLIDQATLPEVLKKLEALIEKKAKETAEALFAHGRARGDPKRIAKALASGKWPKNGDPAEEAAAFGFQLLKYARVAVELGMGVCWEYRGEIAEAGDVETPKQRKKRRARRAPS
jgi:hypothetical protein